MAAQTRAPVAWIVVDDGSTDATADVLAELAAQYDWVQRARPRRRGPRRAAGRRPPPSPRPRRLPARRPRAHRAGRRDRQGRRRRGLRPRLLRAPDLRVRGRRQARHRQRHLLRAGGRRVGPAHEGREHRLGRHARLPLRVPGRRRGARAVDGLGRARRDPRPAARPAHADVRRPPVPPQPPRGRPRADLAAPGRGARPRVLVHGLPPVVPGPARALPRRSASRPRWRCCGATAPPRPAAHRAAPTRTSSACCATVSGCGSRCGAARRPRSRPSRRRGPRRSAPRSACARTRPAARRRPHARPRRRPRAR